MQIDFFGFTVSLPLYAFIIPVTIHILGAFFLQKRPQTHATHREAMKAHREKLMAAYLDIIHQKGEAAGTWFLIKENLLGLLKLVGTLCFVYLEIRLIWAALSVLLPAVYEIDKENFSHDALASWRIVLICFFFIASTFFFLCYWALGLLKKNNGERPDALTALSRRLWLSRITSMMGLVVAILPLWLELPLVETGLIASFIMGYGMYALLQPYRTVMRTEATREICGSRSPLVFFFRPGLLRKSR